MEIITITPMVASEEQCREIVELDRSILLAAIIENANLLGSHFRKTMVPPNEQRFKVFRIQTELMLSMAKNNDDYFGELSYLMFHSKLLDVFLFPMGKSRRLKLMAVALKRPYDHDQITRKILARLAKLKD
jgi:hypothetical protein